LFIFSFFSCSFSRFSFTGQLSLHLLYSRHNGTGRHRRRWSYIHAWRGIRNHDLMFGSPIPAVTANDYSWFGFDCLAFPQWQQVLQTVPSACLIWFTLHAKHTWRRSCSPSRRHVSVSRSRLFSSYT
jgi:hypothetical protein